MRPPESRMTRLSMLDDVQGDVLRRYRKKKHARYLFAEVKRSSQTRTWLRDRLRENGFTTGGSYDKESPEPTLNVAFSHRGLLKLGVPEIRLEHLAVFREGMKGRAGRLGDAWESWEPELRGSDVLLVLTSKEPQAIEQAEAKLLEELAQARGVEVTHTEQAATLPDKGEHFGFRDGFSQPSIEGVKSGPRRGEGVRTRWGGWRRLALGEFVLGYRDEGGLYSPAPLGPLGDAASFMVVRKLKQDVMRFRRYTKDEGDRLHETADWVQAKMVGRWKTGTALAVSPFHAQERPTGEQVESERKRPNNFRYANDPYGLRCPVGAHVRRAFPRDQLGWQGRLTERHRIIRRGMPYGPVLADGADEDDGQERGLMFVCYQASIERQFEFIQQQWLGNGDAFKLGSERDPLTSPGGGDGDGQMIVIGPERRALFLAGIPSFVKTRGGGYYLLPGRRGLQALADGSC